MGNGIPILPFGAIGPEVDALGEQVANRLERSWPAKWAQHGGAHVLLAAQVAAARNMYRAVRFLCADQPPDPARKPELALCVPSLNRSVLDLLFAVVFELDDLPVKSVQFYKGGWREIHEEHERYLKWHSCDAEFTAWLSEKSAFLSATRALWGITADEAASPSKLAYWPTPGQMLKRQDLSPDRREFLNYLDAWYYKELSSSSHASWPGLSTNSAALLNPDEVWRTEQLAKFKSDCVMRTMMFLLSIYSEIELVFQFGSAAKLRYAWSILGPYRLEAKELYELRYAPLLPA